MSGASKRQSSRSGGEIQSATVVHGELTPPAPQRPPGRRIRLPTIREAFEPIPGLVIRPATGEARRGHSFGFQVNIDFGLAEQVIALVMPLLPLAQELYRRQEEEAARDAQREREERRISHRLIGLRLSRLLRLKPADREATVLLFVLRTGLPAHQLEALAKWCATAARKRLARRRKALVDRHRPRVIELRAAGYPYRSIAARLRLPIYVVEMALRRPRDRRVGGPA